MTSSKTRFLILGALLVMFGALGWVLASRPRWDPAIVRAPSSQSGRPSLCESPGLSEGSLLRVQTQSLGEQPASRGIERSYTYTFEAGGLTGGKLVICSEYGRVSLRGIDATTGRVLVKVVNPFPVGDRAVADTQWEVDARAVGGALQLAVWQTKQGLTAFRSLFSRGTRPTMVHVEVQVPRSGPYDVRLVANHRRASIIDLDVRGSVQGYGSPGADIDVRLAGPLQMQMQCDRYVNRFPEDFEHNDQNTGITARIVALQSTDFDARCDEDDVRILLPNDGSGVDVTASAASRQPVVEIGGVDVTESRPNDVRTRTEGFDRAAVQLRVRAISSNGAVEVRRE